MVDEKELEDAFEAEVADIQPTPALWERVREHTIPRRQSQWGWTKRSAGVVAAALVLITVGTASAQGGLLWRFFAGSKAPPPKPAPGGTSQSSYQELPPDEAGKLVGFRIHLPTVLPEGVNPGDVSATVIYDTEKRTPLVIVGYWTVKLKPNGSSTTRVFALQQRSAGDKPSFRPENFTTPSGEPLHATCQQDIMQLHPDIEAIWFNCDKGGSFLTWARDGFEFKISDGADKLSREQLIAIGRSVE